ncbi:hypothetical protein OPQ81_010175 [Rhizoctonia solani]|nr:hypothetical protein OPQ81_010175 [Rhizoctonia solani]
MSVDPWHDVKNEVQNSLEAATNLRASFLRIQSTASANSEELNWARNELKGTLAALDADLEDLEESVRIVEETGGRLFGVEETEVMARRKYVVYVRNQIETMRKEVNASVPLKSPSTAQMRHSPSIDAGPHEDDQAEWSRLEQQLEVQRQESTLDTISGTLHTLATQASLIGQEVGEHNELLSELEANVDRSGSKLDSAMKKMKHFIRETEETKSGWCIGILIVILCVLLLAVILSIIEHLYISVRTLGSLYPFSITHSKASSQCGPVQTIQNTLIPSELFGLKSGLVPPPVLIESKIIFIQHKLSQAISHFKAGMDINTVRRALIGVNTPSFVIITTLFTYTALSLRPGFVPLVVLLSILINYTRATVKRPQFSHRFFALLIALTMGTVFAYSGSTQSALSRWFLSESLLMVISLLFSFISLLPILAFAHSRSYVGSQSPLSGLLLFPVLWATTWSLVVHVSPIGRLGTWTPMTGIESYLWVLPIFGQPGLDYITGLWAIVLAEYAGAWLMGTDAQHLIPDSANSNIDFLVPIDHETEAIDVDHQANTCSVHKRFNSTQVLLVLLLIGMIPSYFKPILPPPTHSNSTTELTVACAHPGMKTPGTRPSFEDYLAETRTQASRAKVVLWPEGAVHFNSDAEKKAAFNNVSDIANKQKAWIGVGYEQTFLDRDLYDGLQRVRGHNGLVIFGPDVQPVVYIKQKLVPLVESFSYEHSIVPPSPLPAQSP